MNIVQIMITLQMALSLLMSPQVQSNPVLLKQAVDIANQTIISAQQELNKQPTNLGAGVIVVEKIEKPSCSLVVNSIIKEGATTPSISVEIMTENFNQNTQGILYSNYNGKIDGGIIQYDQVRNINSENKIASGLSYATNFKATFDNGIECYSK